MNKMLKQILGVLLAVNLVLLTVVQVLAIIRLWPGGSTSRLGTSVSTPGASGSTEEFELAAQILPDPEFGSSLHFECPLTNSLSVPVTLESWQIEQFHGGEALGEPIPVPFRDFLGEVVIQPGQTFPIEDNLPEKDAQERGLTSLVYTFVLSDGSGNTLIKVFRFSYGSDTSQSAQTNSQQSGGSNVTEEVELTAQINDTPDFGRSLHFECSLFNSLSVPVSLESWQIQDFRGSEPIGEPIPVSFRDFLGEVVIQPGQTFPIEDNLPEKDVQERGLTSLVYTFVLSDSNGSTLTKVFRFSYDPDMKAPSEIDYRGDSGRDLTKVRYDADFAVEVYPGVQWVPIRSLGGSRYTNGEIYAMLRSSPQEKQGSITTLYEAIQLYQIGNFHSSDDNIVVTDPDGREWEHHKPGFDAVRTNTGCCASSADWLNYILSGDYEEVGFIAYNQPQGGHVFNYIKDQNFYYIIDMTHYRTDWNATALETGDLNDHNVNDSVLSSLHRVADLNDFVSYIRSAYTDPPGLILTYQAENCLAINPIWQNTQTLNYEQAEGVPIQVLFDDPKDTITFGLVPGPASRPDYGREPDCAFPG